MVIKNKTYEQPSLKQIELEASTVLCYSFEANDVQYDDYYKNVFGSYED